MKCKKCNAQKNWIEVTRGIYKGEFYWNYSNLPKDKCTHEWEDTEVEGGETNGEN